MRRAETHVYKIPEHMSWHQAVVLTVWMTAHHALFDVAQLKAGEVVMIHAAGSGVSMAGIQLAKRVGAQYLQLLAVKLSVIRRWSWENHTCINREHDIAQWAREVTHVPAMSFLTMLARHYGHSLCSR